MTQGLKIGWSGYVLCIHLSHITIPNAPSDQTPSHFYPRPTKPRSFGGSNMRLICTTNKAYTTDLHVFELWCNWVVRLSLACCVQYSPVYIYLTVTGVLLLSAPSLSLFSAIHFKTNPFSLRLYTLESVASRISQYLDWPTMMPLAHP